MVFCLQLRNRFENKIPVQTIIALHPCIQIELILRERTEKIHKNGNFKLNLKGKDECVTDNFMCIEKWNVEWICAYLVPFFAGALS